MLSLDQLDRFERALQNNYVVFNKEGIWRTEGWFFHIFRVIFGGENKRIERIGVMFSQFLDRLEGPQSPVLTGVVLDKIERIANSILLKTKKKNPLLQRLVALRSRYKIEEGNDLHTLFEKGQKWKNDQEALDERPLSEEDRHNLSFVGNYASFHVLLNQKEIADKFFSWTLRYRLPAEIFIFYPGLCDRLVASTLHDTLGSDRGYNLRIEHGDVTLLIEGGTRISLFDEDKKVYFPSGNETTVKEILFEFKERDYRNIDLRYFPHLKYPDKHQERYEGICEWKIHKMADQINFEQEEFWKDFPPIMRMTPQEATAYFGKEANGIKWMIAASSTRRFRKMTFEGTHSYLEIAVPMDDGNYTIYPIGKFPKTYPRYKFENRAYLFETQESDLHYPDDNCDYRDREHTRIAFSCSAKKGKNFFHSIKRDFLKHDLVFQLAVYNCSSWVYKKLKKYFKDEVPELFDVSLFDMCPGGTTEKVLHYCKDKKWLHTPIIYSLSYLGGGKKGRITSKKNGEKYEVSLLKFKPWEKERGFHVSSKIFKT